MNTTSGTSEATPSPSIPGWMKWLIGLGAFLLVSGGVYGFINGTRNQGITYETALTAQYLANQNNLSAYISGFYEQLGVANKKSEQLDKILLDAVKGRYENNGGPPDNGKLFSAIVEAYPDLSGLNAYDKIIDYIKGGRESYKTTQDKLLDMLRAYDAWRDTGLIKMLVVRMFDFPTNRLMAKVGEVETFGNDARKQMYAIVLTGDALDAYNKGTMDPLKVQ